MKNRAIVVTVAVLGLSALASSTLEGVVLKRTPKVGETRVYSMKVDLNVQGQEINVSMTNNQKFTVVNDDGSYVVEEKVTDQVVMAGGQEIPGAGGEDSVSKTTYGADGNILKVDAAGAGADETMIAYLNNTLWPKEKVDVGSKWTSATKADTAKGVPAISYTFEVLGREKLKGFDTFKIKSVATQSGDGTASASSTVWVDIATGLTVAGNGMMKGVPIMGMPMDASWTMELKQ